MVDGVCLDPAPVVSGVQQVTVLGPIFFLLFINDLPNELNSSTRLFTDNCIVYRIIRTEDDCKALQKDLNTLTIWEQRWGMQFHSQKCNALSCTRARNPFTFNYTLKGHTLTYEQTSKYLGVDISKDLNWNTHIERVTKKANCMLGFLRRNLKIPNRQTKTNAYFTLVRPHIEYCCTIWNPSTKDGTDRVEAVQRRAARYVCNQYGRTESVTKMINELDWESLSSRRTKIQLTMLYKIINHLIDIPPDPYLSTSRRRLRSNHSLKYNHYSTRTDIFKFSFFPRVIPTWNLLPATVAEAPCLTSFKRELSKLSF